MKEEYVNWIEEAEDDLGTASDCKKVGRLKASAFYSHQAAEKALKALQIKNFGRFDRVHDLLSLAGSMKAPDDIMVCCIKLDPYYTAARYPDVKERVGEDTAAGLLENSRKVVEWASRMLKR